MVCLGSSQHLKTRYGTEYTLEAKTKNGYTIDDSEDDGLIRMVQRICPSAAVSERPSDSFVKLTLGVPEDFSLASLFEVVEASKERLGLDAAAYSISQATLEQVFLRFSGMSEGQIDERMHAIAPFQYR